MSSKSIYIISNAGGPMVATVDLISDYNLTLGSFSKDLQGKLQSALPKVGNIKNPLDIIGDADAKRYQDSLDLILQDKNVNNVLVLLTPQTTTEVEKTATIIGNLSKKYPDKIIITSFIGGKSLSKAEDILAKNKVVNFNYPSQAVSCLAKIMEYKENLRGLKIYQFKDNKNKSEQKTDKAVQLDYLESFEILKKYNIKTTATVAIDDNNIKKLGNGLLNFPLVLKVVGPKLIHKTDMNSLALNLINQDQVSKAYQSFAPLLADKENYSVAQEMVKGAFEMILGFRRDDSFGPIIMIGAGGIYTEIIKDIQSEVDDLDEKRAIKMLKKLKIYPILKGARGQAAYDINGLAQAIVNMAKLARDKEEIKELDINPLFIDSHQSIAADIRIIV